jgi:hypothetical protein
MYVSHIVACIIIDVRKKVFKFSIVSTLANPELSEPGRSEPSESSPGPSDFHHDQ